MNQVPRQQFANVPISAIVESPTNPRKNFNPEKLDELANSIAEIGIGQPILVRHTLPLEVIDNPNAEYEIIAGARRFRAAKLAGLDEVPVLITVMTDAQVREFQIIENLQRDDVDAIEEAESYQALMDDFNVTAEEIAVKVGKSRSYVFGRLKLLDLAEGVRHLLVRNQVPASTALLIARLSDDDQHTAAVHIASSATPLSYRDAQSYIAERFKAKPPEVVESIDDDDADNQEQTKVDAAPKKSDSTYPPPKHDGNPPTASSGAKPKNSAEESDVKWQKSLTARHANTNFVLALALEVRQTIASRYNTEMLRHLAVLMYCQFNEMHPRSYPSYIARYHVTPAPGWEFIVDSTDSVATFTQHVSNLSGAQVQLLIYDMIILGINGFGKVNKDDLSVPYQPNISPIDGVEIDAHDMEIHTVYDMAETYGVDIASIQEMHFPKSTKEEAL